MNSLPVPSAPINFTVVREYSEEEFIIVTLIWNVIPDISITRYKIFIRPNPVSGLSLNSVQSSPLNVSLNYNTKYEIKVTAINCAGESNPSILSEVLYGQ